MSLIKNAVYNIIYQLFNIVVPLITVPYISRVLGSTGVGEYSYTNSYVQYFMVFGMLGISLYGSRQIAYKKNDKGEISKEFWNIYSLQFICTFISLILFLLFFVFINKNNRLLYLAQSINLLVTMLDISWFFIGYEEMKKVVIRNLIAKLIGVVLIFMLVKEQNDIVLYTVILSTSMLFGQVVMWFSLKTKVIFVKPQILEIKRHFMPASGLFISQLAVQLYVLLDKTMLGIITTASEVGYYENSQKTIKLALTLATSIGVVMLPRMSNLFANNKTKEFKEMIYKSFSFINLIAIPTFVGLISIADGFAPWFYGENFLGIETLIKTGALILIPISISNVLGMQILIPIGREKKFTISVLCGLTVNIILNSILISPLGAKGATIASVFAEFVITIVQLYYLRDIVNLKRVFKTLKNPILGSAAMYFVLFLVSNRLNISILSTIIEVTIGGIIYLIVILLLRDTFLIEMINKIIKKI